LKTRVDGESAPALDDLTVWADISSQLHRVSSVTSEAFKNANIIAVKEVDSRLDIVRSHIEETIDTAYTKALENFLQVLANEQAKPSDVLPALRPVRNTLKSSEVSDFAKVSVAERCADFDKKHGERLKFCDSLSHGTPFAFVSENDEADDFPEDVHIAHFMRHFGGIKDENKKGGEESSILNSYA